MFITPIYKYCFLNSFTDIHTTQYPDYVFILFSLYYVYWCWDDILKGYQRAGPKKAHVSATGINFIYSLVGSTSADGHDRDATA